MAPPQNGRRRANWLTPALILIVVVALLGNVYAYLARSTPAYDLFREASPPSTATAPELHRVSGVGEQNSEPLTFRGGNYVVEGAFLDDCAYYLDFKALGGSVDEDAVDFTGVGERENRVYELPSGTYYVEPITSRSECRWSLTIRSLT